MATITIVLPNPTNAFVRKVAELEGYANPAAFAVEAIQDKLVQMGYGVDAEFLRSLFDYQNNEHVGRA